MFQWFYMCFRVAFLTSWTADSHYSRKDGMESHTHIHYSRLLFIHRSPPVWIRTFPLLSFQAFDCDAFCRPVFSVKPILEFIANDLYFSHSSLQILNIVPLWNPESWLNDGALSFFSRYSIFSFELSRLLFIFSSMICNNAVNLFLELRALKMWTNTHTHTRAHTCSSIMILIRSWNTGDP